jgi:hypothetical protein
VFVGKVPARLQGAEVRDAKPPRKRSRVFSPVASNAEQQADYDSVCAELVRLRSQIRVFRGLEATMVARRDELARMIEGDKDGSAGSEGSEDEVEGA